MSYLALDARNPICLNGMKPQWIQDFAELLGFSGFLFLSQGLTKISVLLWVTKVNNCMVDWDQLLSDVHLLVSSICNMQDWVFWCNSNLLLLHNWVISRLKKFLLKGHRIFTSDNQVHYIFSLNVFQLYMVG